jgi:PAS domain S-box-containing protein
MGVYNPKLKEYRWISIDAVPMFKPGENKPYQVYTQFKDITERKRLEGELAQTSSYLENLINYANAPIIVWDPRYKITRFNQAFEHLTGLKAEDVIGKSIKILFAPDKLKSSMKLIWKTTGGERLDVIEIPIHNIDGYERIVLWSSATIFAKDGKTPVGTIAQGQDITERKRIEVEISKLNASLEKKVIFRTKELTISEERYRLLYETSQDAIMLLSPKEGFFAGNPATIKLFGCHDETEFTNYTPADLSPEYQPDGEESVIKAQEMIKTALENGSHYFEWEYRRLDGTQFPASVLLTKVKSGNKTYIQATVRDISQQKNYETELRLHHEHLEQLVFERTAALENEITEHRKTQNKIMNAARQWRTTFDSLNDIVCLLDTEQRIIRCNKATVTFFNKDFPDILGSPCWELIHGSTCPEKECIILRMKKSLKRESTDIQIGDGFYTETVEPVFDDDGTLSSMVLILRDITRIKKALNEKANLKDKLWQVQKNESLGRVSAGIAHDFNNLFQSILGNIELSQLILERLEQKPDKIIDVQKNLLSAKLTARRAAELTSKIHSYSGHAFLNFEFVNLNDLIKDTINAVKGSLPENISLTFVKDDELPVIKGDAGQIRKVITDLLTNSAEAIGDHKGVITIKTGVQMVESNSLEGDGANEKLPEGLYAYFIITDTGHGINPDDIAKVFDPFFTTKFIGRGLGLSAAYGIISSHNGSIRIMSEAGAGSQFCVLLPAIINRDDDKPQEAGNNFYGIGKNEYVLFADDNEDIVKATEKMLNMFEFRILKATHGKEALDIFENNVKNANNEDRIKCIILDFQMPGMNGVEAYNAIRKIDPDIPVILTSGFDEEYISSHFPETGKAVFIQKPFLSGALCQKILEVTKKI